MTVALSTAVSKEGLHTSQYLAFVLSLRLEHVIIVNWQHIFNTWRHGVYAWKWFCFEQKDISKFTKSQMRKLMWHSLEVIRYLSPRKEKGNKCIDLRIFPEWRQISFRDYFKDLLDQRSIRRCRSKLLRKFSKLLVHASITSVENKALCSFQRVKREMLSNCFLTCTLPCFFELMV